MSTGRKKGVALPIAAAVVFLGLLAGLALSALAPAAGIPPEGRLFEVRRGESASVLASRLEEAGLLRSALAFKALVRLEGRDGDIQAGTYRIEGGMGPEAIVELFVEGRQALEKLTLPEGLSLSETAKFLEGKGICAAADFMAAARDPKALAALGFPPEALPESAEGYLFPDTYLMPRNFGAARALEAMLGNFRAKIATVPQAAGLDAKALHAKIILASIVEREYRVADEAPLIASVFENRLRIGMALQSCATVVYIIAERQGKPHPEVVYDRDLKIDDPFNTYLHRGLPPGPISNPGMVAIRSVFEAPRTGWLYFRLIDPAKGIHRFSATFDEHLEAARYLVKRSSGE